MKLNMNSGRERMKEVVCSLRPELITPRSIHMSVTNRCNLHCIQCDIPSGRQDREEMKTGQIKKCISEMHEWMGEFALNIAGGEPFLRNDLFEIIDFCNSLGIKVTVTTNGTLINRKTAERIAKSGIHSINISLDGINENTHDFIRRRKGTYRKVMLAIEYLNKPRDFCLVITTILMGYNLNEIMELVEWAEENNLNGIIFQPLFHNFGSAYMQGWWKESILWPREMEKLDRVMDKLAKRRKKGSKIINSIGQLNAIRRYFHHPETAAGRCRVGSKNFAVNEYGDALLCFWLRGIGSILDKSPRRIWCSDSARRLRAEIRRCRMNCSLLNCHWE